MATRRIETRASRTAAYTCFLRACAIHEKAPRFRGPDSLVEVFLPPIPRFMLEFAPARKILRHKMFPAGIYEYVCVGFLQRGPIYEEAIKNKEVESFEP